MEAVHHRSLVGVLCNCAPLPTAVTVGSRRERATTADGTLVQWPSDAIAISNCSMADCDRLPVEGVVCLLILLSATQVPAWSAAAFAVGRVFSRSVQRR